MLFTRRGKCTDCSRPTVQKKEILITVDMFDPNPKTYLKGPVLQELRAWRKQPILCGGDACIESSSQLQSKHNHSNERSE